VFIGIFAAMLHTVRGGYSNDLAVRVDRSHCCIGQLVLANTNVDEFSQKLSGYDTSPTNLTIVLAQASVQQKATLAAPQNLILWD